MSTLLEQLAEDYLKGGAGSGNFGHAGRPGERGGSSSEGVSIARVDEQQVQSWKDAADTEAGKLAAKLLNAVRYLKGTKGIYDSEGKLQAFYSLTTADGKPFEASSLSNKAKVEGKWVELTAVATAPWNIGKQAGYGGLAIRAAIDDAKRVDAQFLTGYAQSKEGERAMLKAGFEKASSKRFFLKLSDTKGLIEFDWYAGEFDESLKAAGSKSRPADFLFLGRGMTVKGGAGSGNFGHEGRPGERGGSSSSGDGKISRKPSDDEVVLYRGMSQESFDSFKEDPVFEVTHHAGNVASTEQDTADHYANQHDDPGVVIRFYAPSSAVKEDDIFKGDFRITSGFKVEQWERVDGGTKSLKATDASKKKRFEDFLDRAEMEGFLDGDQIDELRDKFAAGTITDDDIPLALDEAIDADLEPEQVEESRSRLGLVILGAALAVRSAMRDKLQTDFEDRVMDLAKVESITDWQTDFRDYLAENILDQSTLGRGKGWEVQSKDDESLRAVSEVIQEQQAYLSRFTDERAARALTGDELTDMYIAARSALYSGAGRAEWFRGELTKAGEGDVVYYRAVGDADTCEPCKAAEEGSPYLPDDPDLPYPGDVCEGHGYCRCEHEVVNDPELFATLGDESKSYKGGAGSGNFGHSGRLGERGGSSSSTSTFSPGQDATLHPAVNRFLDESLDSKENVSSNHEEVIQALTQAESHRIILTSGDKLRAAAAYSFTPSGISLDHLGSLEKGAGREAVKIIVDKAIESRKPLHFTSTKEAEGFYSKLGFRTKSTEGEYKVSVSILKMIREKLLKPLKSLKGGAGSGNFGHEGRPGERGGSGSGGMSRDKDGTYRDATGKAVSKADQARLAALKLPPAWTDVHLSPDPKAALQATGRDAKGRIQRVYSAEHSERMAAEKFSRLKDFTTVMPKLQERIKSDLDSPTADQNTREAAAALYLIERTGFRVGSDRETGADKQAYGATTLRAEHVKIEGNKISFTFVGKKGVDIQKTVTDGRLARLLTPRVEAGGRLFNTNDSKVRDYLHSIDGNFKVKDFRTYTGTATALRVIEKMRPAKDEKEFAKFQLEVSKKVAETLGNTPAIAKASYIDPAVWGRLKGRP